MSVKQLCPKCGNHELNVQVKGLYKVGFDVDGEGNVIPAVIAETQEPTLDFEHITCGCSEDVYTINDLVQGRQSSLSGKWYPIEQLVSWEEDGETKLATQEEFDAAQAPKSVDEMNEEELREHAKNQTAEMEALKVQMAEMMAMMQQMQAGNVAPAQPAQEPAKAIEAPAQEPAKTEAPKAEPIAVDTNIQAPYAGSDEVQVVEESVAPTGDKFEVIDVTGGDEAFGESEAVGKIFEEEEAPF